MPGFTMKFMSTPSKPKGVTRLYQGLAYITFFLFLGVLWINTLSSNDETYWVIPNANHSASTPELWALSDIYMGEGLKPEMVAVEGKLILLGSDEITRRKGVIAFDGPTGNVIWRSDFYGLSVVTVGARVIVGGFSRVLALNSENGQTLWETHVPANVGRVELRDNLLYVVGGDPPTEILDPGTGNIVDQFEEPFSFWQEPSLGSSLFRTGRGEEIIAIDAVSGLEIWRKEAKIISNLAITPSHLYALDLRGDLLRIDPLTGYSEIFVQFIPAPFNLQNEDNGVRYNYYYIAAEPLANFLFVYLGDSAQLFAFEIDN
jgi:outer membrane protein assembly factor BamB